MSLTHKNDIVRAEELHQQAMNLAEEAFAAKMRGDVDTTRLVQQAFEYERTAASMVADDLSFEPSRSILHRSAAALAIDCGEFRAAERLICTALAGNPPDDIAEELREMFQHTGLRRDPEASGMASDRKRPHTS